MATLKTATLKTDTPDDTIVLVPTDDPVQHYPGSPIDGFAKYKYFMYEGSGPFPIRQRKVIKINKVDGVFDSFEFVDRNSY